MIKGLNIIVTVKQVPDTTEVRIDPKTNTLIREGIPNIINPDDMNAVEAALALKELHGGTVTAVTMGPPQAEEALEEIIAMGADRGILLTDRAFAGSDTLVTAFTLSRAVMKIKNYDLILCGRQAIDGDTAQVGPQIASFLNLPQVTCAEEIKFENGKLVIKRSLEDCVEMVRLKLPALVTVTSAINEPRYAKLYNIEKACDGSMIGRWDVSDMKIPEPMLGLKGSPTIVKRIFEPKRNKKGEILHGSVKEMAGTLIQKLKDMNYKVINNKEG
ncbi:MAG: electron transfer flavoprotein subunit beta/FixA family protein [Spirochaetes bacterium]|nr:electron transfer flavoprotein subunit beta/FixA family protein [Spirochaetota bacterium]